MAEEEGKKAFLDSGVWLSLSKGKKGAIIIIDNDSPLSFAPAKGTCVLTAAVSQIKKLFANEIKGVMFSYAELTREEGAE